MAAPRLGAPVTKFPRSSPGVLDVALISQQDGGEVARQFLLTQGLQEAAGRLKAGPLAHRVHHQEGVAPAEVVEQTPRCLETQEHTVQCHAFSDCSAPVSDI